MTLLDFLIGNYIELDPVGNFFEIETYLLIESARFGAI